MDMESSNPVLNERTFGAARVGLGVPAMTLQGTVNKCLILLAIVMITAGWSWSQGFANAGYILVMMYGSMFAGLGFCLATSFRPQWSAVTAPLYAASEGVFLGVLSALFESKFHGIVLQAVGLTFAVTLAMLVGYKSGWLQATPGLRKGLSIALGGLFIFYMLVMVVGFFGIHPPAFLYGGGPLGIAFSLFVVGIAALFLVIDFDFIESASREGLEKYMEWYGAFALMVTLIWLYVQILQLLAQLQRRN